MDKCVSPQRSAEYPCPVLFDQPRVANHKFETSTCPKIMSKSTLHSYAKKCMAMSVTS